MDVRHQIQHGATEEGCRLFPAMLYWVYHPPILILRTNSVRVKFQKNGKLPNFHITISFYGKLTSCLV